MQLTALFKFCRVLTGAILALGLFSCANQPLNFTLMSEGELLAYNSGRPVLKQVYCREIKLTSSHIRRNVCKRVEDWVQHNMRTMMTIGTMSVSDYSVFGRSLD
ncbi:MAG TPA: hypothetical protein DDZ21_06785 [Gammaproteobacteria bacterium]|nr:hypothetical protein [Gammaproteobacteria bacterium]HCA36983.1 hypothetical protein [Gammaproteobacteria bacterium]HCL71697.1 hypothetical protein [Gammaproteobacteria bacterium]|tara:strand:- start:141 stop:452 length:312 start_codon:yes stop_codon:yes gene_type:complete